MFFDTHAHYDDRRFNADRETLLKSMRANGVDLIVNAGSGMKESRAGLVLADAYSFVYASIGVHPHDAKTMNNASAGELREMLKHPKAVAVGEIGLDYHYDFSPRDVQRKRFVEQLDLAREVNMPVIIHEREAFSDVMDILAGYRDLSLVFHCFSGDWESAQSILDCGWMISFTGVVTFKNNIAVTVAQRVPLDRIMLETDAPYLAPEPYRGKRNDSTCLKFTAQCIADARGMDIEELAAVTKQNGLTFFGIEQE